MDKDKQKPILDLNNTNISSTSAFFTTRLRNLKLVYLSKSLPFTCIPYLKSVCLICKYEEN